jgi:hypothetical protein
LTFKSHVNVSTLVPNFYLYTALDVLAIPEPADAEPHSTRVTLVAVPTLEEGIGPAGRRAVITLVIGGVTMQSRTVASGETVQYSTTLYDSWNPADQGVIYVRQIPGDPLDARRVDLLMRLNSPDYEVIGLPDGVPPSDPDTRRIVQVSDDAMLRVPVREIARHFSSVIAVASTVIAPSVASFVNFGTPSGGTSFISLSDYEHFTFVPGLSSLAIPLQQGTTYQTPIKMTKTGWIVFGVLWGLLALSCIGSIIAAYWWYISQYL